MKFRVKVLPLLLTAIVFAICCADAATNDLPPVPDPAFAAGFATLKQATGFIEPPAGHTPTVWQPNLQLWVGVKAGTSAKPAIYFVQLTTLPLTNAAGSPGQPALRTNHWDWSGTNQPAPRHQAQYITTRYPVRVRVCDQDGKQLKDGQTPMAWGMLTNGLVDLCRLSRQFYPPENKSPGAAIKRSSPSAGHKELSEAENDELMRAVGGGYHWMIGMLGDLQTVPTLADVWAKAQCAIRWPSLWTVAASVVRGLAISIEPRYEEVTLASAPAADRGGPFYCLPVDLNSGKRKLSRVEIIVGPAHGAEMLLAGIRSVRATHPTKPQQEFLAQVLAAGTGREEK